MARGPVYIEYFCKGKNLDFPVNANPPIVDAADVYDKE